ncbi:hypothetical protein [Actinoplanes regularis]|uniref:hypothetical protein n=1 Tax=Actinoplanes regularis TaxID=52697 RepID=UPI0024A0F69D|nr:hypothetical protein [Actinoplanes regularis]GLW35941.1 hypothetical protein Areg01_88760 [Actinoplanes regularis]
MAERKTTVPGLVTTAWHGAPAVLKRFAGWVWGIGIPVAVLSIIGDLAGWWGDYQFIPNIVSEVICAMVTLPIALVIIGQLAEYQVKELERVRLDTRFASTRQQLVIAARTTRDQIQERTRDVEATTNEFVRAAKVEDGRLADPDAANAAARLLHTQMDGQQWLMYHRITTPLRILGSHLHTLLVERDRDGDLTAETTGFAQLWLDLESALAAQRQIMAAGHDLFGQPALSARTVPRADRLRDVALEHIRTIDRLIELCQQLEHQAGGEQPAVTP